MSEPPYDERLENEAIAADQCMRLGAVLLNPPQRPMGFAQPSKQEEGSSNEDRR